MLARLNQHLTYKSSIVNMYHTTYIIKFNSDCELMLRIFLVSQMNFILNISDMITCFEVINSNLIVNHFIDSFAFGCV